MSDQPDNSKCPVCGSPHIEGGIVEICGMEAVQEMICTECGASWEEVYTFTRRDNINEGTPDKRKEA
ncbi:hypothetical protein PDESU_00953 [Pontiella desulfatans]|uniref:Uncharacterized protein n=1 Tax=Pontiella desulfatans TaxID=2750659 RepID=A0A6C2TYH3_PONDE|nr:hypothetical protein [Pontiella desulfatans]VGO12401.1 hypothetical protein PDESU_00953 [Pontiella desulfatans]